MMKNIKTYRKQIENIDQTIIKLLAKRKEISIDIGQCKLQQGKNIIDKNREKKLNHFHKKWATTYKLQPTFIKKLFKLIIINSRKMQK